MGLQVSFRFHPAFPAQVAHVVIDAVVQSYVGGGITLQLCALASVEKLKERRAALADILRLTPQCVAPKDLKEPDKAKASDAEKKAFQAVMAPIERASAEIKIAQAVYNDIQPFAVPGLNMQLQVPVDQLKDVTNDDGDTDIEKCYAWLAKQPGFAPEEG